MRYATPLKEILEDITAYPAEGPSTSERAVFWGIEPKTLHVLRKLADMCYIPRSWVLPPHTVSRC